MKTQLADTHPDAEWMLIYLMPTTTMSKIPLHSIDRLTIVVLVKYPGRSAFP